ncbi:MAG TPA: hypothetical protein VJT78_09825 [Candidatus Dormibacteraeota bacterium]|nr:hypothetical protein [Candidatus Dormibacteraeota bacterium]
MAGGLTAVIVLIAAIAFGFMLGGRVANPIPLLVLTLAGAYGGWLLGVVVYGAVRGGDVDEHSR